MFHYGEVNEARTTDTALGKKRLAEHVNLLKHVMKHPLPAERGAKSEDKFRQLSLETVRSCLTFATFSGSCRVSLTRACVFGSMLG